MKLPKTLQSFHFSLVKKKRKPVLLYADRIWLGALVFLGILFLALVLFDGYIFFFRTQRAGSEASPEGGQDRAARFSERLLDDGKKILEKREKDRQAAGEGLPSRNPFEYYGGGGGLFPQPRRFYVWGDGI